jgi:hypothetical protein
VKPFVTIYITFFSLGVFAQGDLLSKKVTFDYENIRLKEALTDLTGRYQVPFSYSSDYVNVRQRVTAAVKDAPLSIALDKLFEKSSIAWASVGGHIILRLDQNKTLSQREDTKQSRKKKQKEPTEEQPAILVSSETLPPVETPPPPPVEDSIIAVQMPDIQAVRRDGEMYPFDETLLNFEKWRIEADWTIRRGDEKKIAQISVLPFIGTNTLKSHEITNNVSMNLLWGVNGGVDGLEIGTFVNTVRNDVKGFQAAGLGNTVKRNVTGTQVGGLFNYTGGITRGFQASGLFNFSGEAEAGQAAGLMNLVQGDVTGFQASGLFNSAGGHAKALQAASLFNRSGGDSKVQAAGAFNLSKGNTKVQFGGVFNVAKDVEIAQVSGLLNVAKQVKGLQVGLINISDTVSGAPIGLLNIVKKGYNKFEMYGGEVIHANLMLKLGAKMFYNTFHVGARIPQGDGTYTWAMGYGIGHVSEVSKRSSLNFELMALHVSENEPWTNTLNSIGQFRFLWNFQLGKSIGFFLGPTANVMFSQLKNPETSEPGSSVVPYTLLDEKIGQNTSVKGWVGANAGFRF